MIPRAYTISDEWRGYADRHSTKQAFNSQTILEDGLGQTTGIMGELAFGRWMNEKDILFKYVAKQQLHYDFLVDWRKIDVKTKRCSSVPRANFTAHVTLSQSKFDADIYVFARASERNVWLCGWIKKADFWTTQNADNLRQGQMADGLIQHADARRIQIGFLNPMADLIPELKANHK